MKPKKGDLIVAGVFLSVALVVTLCLLLAPQGHVAVITVDGEEYARLPLDTATEMTVNGTHRVVVADGAVSVVEAPCADKICVCHEPISRAGETIICLPYRVVITVEEVD